MLSRVRRLQACSSQPWIVACGLMLLLLTLGKPVLQQLEQVSLEVLLHLAGMSHGTAITPVPASLAIALNSLPLLVAAGFPKLPGRTLGHGPWLLPLPLLGSAGLLAGWSIWLPSMALTLSLSLGWLLARNRELRRAQRELQQARSQADTTLQAITDGVITIDARRRVRYLNPSAERLVSHALAQAQGLPLADVLALDAHGQPLLDQALSECLLQARVVQIQRPLRVMCQGVEHQVQVTASPVRTSDSTPPRPAEAAADAPARGFDLHPVQGAVLTLTDMTDRLHAASRQQHEATHDQLTGLPNRTLLTDRLQHAVLGAQRGHTSVALLFIDLDRFKRINDSLGHRHGDTVLQVIAQRLRDSCQPHDTVARWGGDEFVVLLEQATSREVVAARAAQIIVAVTDDLLIDEIEVACGCSIGIVMAPQDGVASDALLAMADTAMYRGKARGGKRFEFYAAEMPAWTREWLALETRLRHGLEEHRFELHYQPQVHLVTNRPVGMEALLRWRQPDGELWAPARFLAVTEETGLILSIGEWVIREATRQIARWRTEGLPLLPVSVNVSARQCLDRRLVQVVADALTDSAVPAALLKIEITESTAMSDLGQLHHLLTDLRAMGVSVAMDDFGTGYSSLSYLKRFPVDQIKIDPSFINDITSDPNGAAIVRATIALAHGLGVPVVAEGVESEEQMRFLKLHQCDIAQGYLYAHPQSADDLSVFLRKSMGALA